METEEINEELKNSVSGKKDIKRSASYPSLTVNEAYDFSCKINDKFSAVIEATREEIAHALGLHANTVSRDVAACAAYGFLQKTTGGKYKLTTLFTDIFQPENDKDKRIKLITAFGTPKLYQELISKFDNQVIPQELPNTLIKHHAITEAASKFAADTFVISGQQVGVINDNRALKYNVTLSTISKTQYAEIIDESTNIDSTNQNKSLMRIDKPEFIEDAVMTSGNKRVPIFLTKDKEAYLTYPTDVTASDIAIIKHQLEGILLRIELENKEKNAALSEQ